MEESQALDTVIRLLYEPVSLAKTFFFCKDGLYYAVDGPNEGVEWNSSMSFPKPKFRIRVQDFFEFNIVHTPIDKMISNPKFRARIKEIFTSQGVDLKSLHRATAPF